MAFGPNPDSWVISSVEADHFDTALADGVIDIEDLGVLPTPQVIVSRITVWADENLNWEVSLWRNNTGQPDVSPLEDHGLVEFVSFLVADGVRIGGAGPFIYSISSVDLRWTSDAGVCFVGLVPRGSAKAAGATGNVRIEVSGPVL